MLSFQIKYRKGISHEQDWPYRYKMAYILRKSDMLLVVLYEVACECTELVKLSKYHT